MVNEETILQAVKRLLEAAPGSTVIVFGSYIRGNPTRDSDLDILVVEPVVTSRRDETVRLRKVLASFPVPIDILVVSRDIFEEWRNTPNTVLYEAAREGKAYEQVA